MLLGVVALQAPDRKIEYDAREHARHERAGGESVSRARAAGRLDELALV